VPIRASTTDSDLLMLKVNRDNRIIVEGTATHYIYCCQILMQVESLTKICKGSNKGNEDEDNTYFPTVQELIARQGVSRGHALKANRNPGSTTTPAQRPLVLHQNHQKHPLFKNV